MRDFDRKCAIIRIHQYFTNYDRSTLACFVIKTFVCFSVIMASNFELLSDQGLRSDGRRHGELRRIRCRLGVFGQADGSAYLEQVRLHYVTDSSF